MTQQQKLIIGIIGIVIIAGLVFFNRAEAPTQGGTAQEEATTTSATSTGGLAGAIINSAKPSYPSLNRAVNITADLPENAKQMLAGKITALQSDLSKKPDNYDAWLQLALDYKQAGDYAGAREIWEYISRALPEDIVSRHNLGDLYHHFLVDYPKAESYYKAAISAAQVPQVMDYLALHELYRYSYKQNTSAAVDILTEGAAKVESAARIDIYTALASYYKDKGDTANAITYFTKAREAASAAGQTALVSQLDAEIAALK